MSTLEMIWPSVLNPKNNMQFWEHEYKKHGTCMPQPWYDTCSIKHNRINTEDYFRLVCLLYYKYIGELEDTHKRSQIEYHLDQGLNLIERRDLEAS